MGLFQTVLKDRFDSLPAPVRAVHGGAGKRTFSGRVTVLAPSPVTGRIAAAVIGLPRRAGEVPVTAILELVDEGERWTRIMGEERFSSMIKPSAGGGFITEHLAGVACQFFLDADTEGIGWRLTSYRFLGVPMPKIFWPRARGREFVEDGRYNFDVEVRLPLIGRVLGYRGWLIPAS